MTEQNQVVKLMQKPQGKLLPECFAVAVEDTPQPGEGQVLVRNVLLSIDAANRAWMEGATYRDQVKAGQIMDGYGVGVVVESKSPKFQKGQIVEGDLGWRTYGVHRDKHLIPSIDHRPLSHLLSVMGIAGKTAWHGLFGIGRVQPGETVLVSAAAGSVGSLVGQMAKAHGCKVIGLAGGDEKCAWVKDTLGFDDCLNYKAEGSLIKAIMQSCPEGIAVYFDNVGGPVTEAALFTMQNFGRIVCCGAVSQYDTDSPVSPRGIPGLLVVKRLRMEGFVVMDHADQDPECVRQIKGWLAADKLCVAEDIVEGLDKAPAALIGLLGGDNRGKRMVRVSPDPS